MTFIFIAFAVSFLVILWAGETLPRAIGGIARIFHASEFMTAFVLVATATSIPELFIGISSTAQGVTTISLGNLFGANFANMTLVIGTAAFFAGTLKGDGKISSQNFWIIFALAFLPVLLALDGMVSRIDGVILILAFAAYLGKLLRDRTYFHRAMCNNEQPGFHSLRHLFRHLSRFAIGIALLVSASFILIWSAREIIDAYLGAEFFLFGVVFMAFGTTLPELIFAIRSALAGMPGAVLGNALGSVAFNAVAITGFLAFLRPIAVTFSKEAVVVTAALFAAFILFHIFVYTRNTLTRKEGLLLLLLYVAFLVVNLT